MKTFLLLSGLLLAASACLSAQPDDASQTVALPPVRISADFRQAGLFDLGVSATVIDAETIRQRNATHLEQVLNLAPNVNFSSAASWGRFFQIRGIEFPGTGISGDRNFRGQYTQFKKSPTSVRPEWDVQD